jgi:nitrogen fixation protein
MRQNRPALAAPWITAAVAGAVLIALLLVYFLALRPDEDDVNGDLTATERAAMRAASVEAANILSYRRAHFDDDFQRALSGATGALAKDLRRDKANTQKTITNGKFDMSATVTHVALEEPVKSGKRSGYVVLVTINGYQTNAPNVPRQSQLALTVEKISNKWLVSEVTSIGVGA